MLYVKIYVGLGLGVVIVPLLERHGLTGGSKPLGAQTALHLVEGQGLQCLQDLYTTCSPGGVNGAGRFRRTGGEVEKTGGSPCITFHGKGDLLQSDFIGWA
jgi:hypothetical protein